MTVVAVYHKSVPNAKNQEKIDLLKFFADGVGRVGDRVINVETVNPQRSDVGVIQGWVSGEAPTSQHLILRHRIIKNQLTANKYVVAVDSNLFLYKNKENPLHYLRYSFNDIFPATGIYCDSNIDPLRWKKLSGNLGLTLKDYRTSGSHILLCLQRNGGWSMGNFDVQDWAVETINTIRQYSDRPIVIRAHPGDKASKQYLDRKNPLCKIPYSKNVSLSSNVNLVNDLKNCWAAVNCNSSPVVGAAIEGVPIFVTNPEKSQCKEIANTDLSQIENPTLHERQRWVERLSMFHWNFDELKSGECWAHMRTFIKSNET